MKKPSIFKKFFENAYGLKIIVISGKKLGDGYEGNLDNKYQMQGAFSEMDDDIGWNDFALRNYDPQIGRWIQQDPFQQFASPYVGMGNDPVNLIDPSGGIGVTFCPGTSAFAIFLSSLGYAAGNMLARISTITTIANIAATTGNTLINVEQVIHTSNVINNSISTLPVGTPYSRGFSDAIWDANTFGISDLWGSTSNLSDYDNLEDQEQYLRGRLAGSLWALAQSATEIEGGSSIAAGGAATGPGAAVVSTVGGIVAGHGALVGARATADAAWATAKLIKLGFTVKTATTEVTRPNNTNRARPSEPSTNNKYPKDYVTKNTKNYSAYYKSERETRNLARQKLGKNPVEIEPGKWRSADGKWQFRAKPGDVKERHIHLEELNPQTGEVLQNYHLRW